MEEYNVTIQKESLWVANALLDQWFDYESVDFCEQWFNKAGCLRLVKEYDQSILRNIQLRDHVRQLQKILQNYANIFFSIPTTEPYEFSPQFIPNRSKVPSYSIRDTFLSHTKVPAPRADLEKPFLHEGISPPTPTTGTIVPVSPDSLKILIEEFRLSRQSLLEHYGKELNKSHHKLMEYDTSQSTTGGPIPPHELLHFYHDECSHRKDEMFSEISTSLAPSRNLEKAHALAGLWPRITPRSLLSLLAQDRISTLPDQWKAMITRYAVCLLEYQQSQRILALSSSQKREELLREIESMRSGVLAESTPDWLLVQVRPLCCGRSK